MPLYTTDSIRCEVDLGDNTNMGCAASPPSKRYAALVTGGFTRYPSAYALALKDALAEYAGVEGRGS